MVSTAGIKKQEWLAKGRSEHQKLGVVLGGNSWKQVLLSFFVVWAGNYATLYKYTIPAILPLRTRMGNSTDFTAHTPETPVFFFCAGLCGLFAGVLR